MENILVNFDLESKKVIQEFNSKLYNLATDSEIQDLCNKAMKLYELSEYECKLIEEYFYI